MHERAKIQSATIREALRAHTNAAHELLHQHASFVALFRGELSVPDYRKLMLSLHGFYVALDQEIIRALEEFQYKTAPYRYARRSDILGRDLSDLQFSAEEVEGNRHCERVADIVSPASLGGVLYVVEGAMLGGSTIDRAARELLSDEVSTGRQYWAWCRSEGKHRWAMTLQYLEYLCANGASLEELLTGARETFQALSAWLAPLDKPQLVAEEVRA